MRQSVTREIGGSAVKAVRGGGGIRDSYAFFSFVKYFNLSFFLFLWSSLIFLR
jgi:hypothetical protein